MGKTIYKPREIKNGIKISFYVGSFLMQVCNKLCNSDIDRRITTWLSRNLLFETFLADLTHYSFNIFGT